MDDNQWLSRRFDANQPHLRAVAYRMLGSLSEANDAVQESWLRLSRSDMSSVDNLGGWLTTVVARICLDMLRTRRFRREEALAVQESPAEGAEGTDPEHEAVLADSVGLAMLVVLETLAPAERVAFVLHDMFSVPFDEVAAIVGRSPSATRQLASRARRRVKGGALEGRTAPGVQLTRQREIIEAFLAAARGGDFEGLLAVLDPDVVMRADWRAVRLGGSASELRGAAAVAEQFSGRAQLARAALLDGAVGIVVAPRGRLLLALAVTFDGERITQLDAIADPDGLDRLDLAVLDA